jgi:hypothetical protein
MRAVTLASLFFAATLGCSATANHQFTSGSGAGASGAGASGAGASGTAATGLASTSGGLGGSLTVGSGGSTGSGTQGCTKAAELVYVLSEGNAIYSFDPPSKTFTKLFTLDCMPPQDGNVWAPNSMAIDRNVVAWVNYVGTTGTTDKAGVVFKVDIMSQTCEQTPTVTLQSSQWYRLGMGFATDTAGGTSETLFVTGTGTGTANSPGLGKIDTTTGALTPIAQFGMDATLSGQSAELTGTGDGRLFGYFTTKPNVRVAQIDETTANIVSDNMLAGVPPPAAWAFSFWGGSFYLYDAGALTKSHVVSYDPTTGAIDTMYVPNAGIIIVGAGVSTCAPIMPPT